MVDTIINKVGEISEVLDDNHIFVYDIMDEKYPEGFDGFCIMVLTEGIHEKGGAYIDQLVKENVEGVVYADFEADTATNIAWHVYYFARESCQKG